jgi:outer membrane receptor protein involved in Fe transport
VFANLQNRFRGKDWARGTRVSLSVENLFNQRQKVTDDTGATPYAYQRDYLDPMGRTILLSLRRIF